MKTLGKNSISSFLKIIITAAWYIQLFFLVLLSVLLIIKFITADAIESNLDIRLTQSKPIAVTAAPAASNISKADLTLDSGKLNFTQSKTWALIAYNLGVMWIGFAISLSITYLLRKLFDSLTRNNPFVVGNARHLRQIALLIMLISPATFIRDAFINWYLQQHFVLEGSSIRTHLVIDFQTIFIGLVLLVIAEIFRIGAQMKEEQDLTV